MLAMEARPPRGIRLPALSLTSIASMPQAGTRSYRASINTSLTMPNNDRANTTVNRIPSTMK